MGFCYTYETGHLILCALYKWLYRVISTPCLYRWLTNILCCFYARCACTAFAWGTGRPVMKNYDSSTATGRFARDVLPYKNEKSAATVADIRVVEFNVRSIAALKYITPLWTSGTGQRNRNHQFIRYMLLMKLFWRAQRSEMEVNMIIVWCTKESFKTN